MTNYVQIERDFIERTLKIIDQYGEIVQQQLAIDQQFEVTLLMNCLLGLLVYPQQLATKRRFTKFFNLWLTEDLIENLSDDWGIQPEYIENAGYKDGNKISLQQLTLRNMIRQMRNASAHASFGVNDNTHMIETVAFGDSAENGFRLVLPVGSLEKFVRKLAQSALDNISSKD
jgi:hypothetical protein